ncbi:SpoIIE family protein phosphatase [Pelagicoccus albus]|uniref:SpoIIE family protein phosphatase n=1 Tax=Pelagicoccus albus TaxID=415222 RepID=A0A7X1B9H4_9BACT|nr:SpoIIE family protein phosphatase [Pelagicoccus albus]MBC2608170.1 SpoIIE family protein phosphatase [Pelagicoccus albus]
MPNRPTLNPDLKRISVDIDGYDPAASEDQKVTISLEQLQAALQKAHQAGTENEKIAATAYNPEMFFWQLMDTLPDHVYFKDRRSRFTCVNRAQANFLGLEDPNDAIGMSDFEFFPEDFASLQFEDEQEIIRSGVGYSLHEEKHIRANENQRFLLSSKLPLRNREGEIDGTFGISRDITNRYLAEREVERQRNLLELIIQILPCRIFVRDMEDRFALVNQTYLDALKLKKAEDLLGRKLSDFTDEARVEQIHLEDKRVREGYPIIGKIVEDLGIFNEDSWIVTSKIPLRGREGEIEGIVGMTYDITEQKRAEEEARELSSKLMSKNLEFEAELLVARQLQETLMSMGFNKHRSYTKTGTAWEVEASYFYKPSHHLAGDFFDLVQISENKLGVLVCDVMGHGVKAALVTMLLRGLISELSPLLDQPAKVLGQINKRLCSLAEDQEFPRFTTAIYFTIDLENGSARIANAGHPSPLWKTRDTKGREIFEPCPAGEIGPALGLIPDYEYTRHEFSIEETTEFLLYTDGIIEQKDSEGTEFGIQKLEEILLNNAERSIATQFRTIESALSRSAGSKEFSDDICLVAVKTSPIR